MESKIKFVRRRMSAGVLHVVDVVYKSNYLRTFIDAELPKTVNDFIASAQKTVEQVDPLWGKEIIYTTE